MTDRIYTKEQQEWRDSIISKRKVHIKTREPLQKYIDPTAEMNEDEKRTYYYNNCLFWLVEFIEKRTTKERALQAIEALKNHIASFPD